MSGVEEIPLAAAAGAVVFAIAGWDWLTEGAPAAQKFLGDVKGRIEDAFSDEAPAEAESCPVPENILPLDAGPELPPGGAPEPEPEPEPAPIPVLPPVWPSTHKHKPVIPGQDYTDQTCENARLRELHGQKDAVKITDIPKPPKVPYDESDPRQAAKKRKLCDALRQRERDFQELIRIRDQIQSECFDSPKQTEDEKKRDKDHQDQRDAARRGLQKTQDLIEQNGCP